MCGCTPLNKSQVIFRRFLCHRKEHLRRLGFGCTNQQAYPITVMQYPRQMSMR